MEFDNRRRFFIHIGDLWVYFYFWNVFNVAEFLECYVVVWLVIIWDGKLQEMDFYAWVQGGLGAALHNTFFLSILTKSKVTIGGPRMIPKEQWLVMERQPNESHGRLSLLQHWFLSQRRQLNSSSIIGFMRKLKGKKGRESYEEYLILTLPFSCI